MKWTKFPSDDMLTKKILSQCEAIKGINNITNGLEIAYYLEEVIIRKWNHRQAITDILNVCDEFNKSGSAFNFLECCDITEGFIMLNTIEKIEKIARQDSD